MPRTKRESRLRRELHRHGGPNQGTGHAARQAAKRHNNRQKHNGRLGRYYGN